MPRRLAGCGARRRTGRHPPSRSLTYLLAPARITVKDVLRDGIVCLSDYPRRWERLGATLFLASAALPASLALGLGTAGVPFPVAGGVLLLAQAILTLAVAAERGRRHRWLLMGSLYRSWRQELRE